MCWFTTIPGDAVCGSEDHPAAVAARPLGVVENDAKGLHSLCGSCSRKKCATRGVRSRRLHAATSSSQRRSSGSVAHASDTITGDSDQLANHIPAVVRTAVLGTYWYFTAPLLSIDPIHHSGSNCFLAACTAATLLLKSCCFLYRVQFSMPRCVFVHPTHRHTPVSV